MPSTVMSAQGNPFVLALMDALGLPKHTRSFVLRCEVGQAVTVQCTYMPQADGVEGFDARTLLAEYKLVPASAVTAGDPAEAFADQVSDEPPPPPPGPPTRAWVDHPWPSAASILLGLFGLISAVAVLAYACKVLP